MEEDSLLYFVASLTAFSPFLTRQPSVIIASDQSNARSILVYQKNLDKVKQLTSHSAMGVSGPNCDMINFTEYVAIV
jgi:20S proteasome alpha/beta subunit